MKNENVLHLPSSYLFIIVECQPCICFHQTSHIFVHWFTKISISQAERTEENPRPHELGSLSIHFWQISTKPTVSRVVLFSMSETERAWDDLLIFSPFNLSTQTMKDIIVILITASTVNCFLSVPWAQPLPQISPQAEDNKFQGCLFIFHKHYLCFWPRFSFVIAVL